MLLGGVDDVTDRIEGCTDTRTLLHDGRLAEATTPLELCGGWDDWHTAHVLLSLADQGS